MVDPFVSAHSGEHRQYQRRVHSLSVQRAGLRVIRDASVVCVKTWALTMRNVGINHVSASGSSSPLPFLFLLFYLLFHPSKQPPPLATYLFVSSYFFFHSVDNFYSILEMWIVGWQWNKRHILHDFSLTHSCRWIISNTTSETFRCIW